MLDEMKMYSKQLIILLKEVEPKLDENDDSIDELDLDSDTDVNLF